MGVDFGLTEGLAAASLATAAAGTGLGVLGSMAQTKAAVDQANYQAAVAKNNATIAGYNARSASEAGAAEAQAQGLRERAQMGAIRAAEGAAGLDINEGSDADVRQSQRQAGLQDVGMVEHNAALRSYGYQTQGMNFSAQSGLYGTEAANTQELATLAGGATLLNGVSSLAGKWAGFQQKGLPGSSSGSGSGVSKAFGGVPSFPASSNDF